MLPLHFLLLAIFSSSVLLLCLWWLAKRNNKKQAIKSLSLKVLSIKIPPASADNKDFLKDINLSEQLFNALSGLGQPFVFEAAVHNVGSEISFYLAVPRESIDFATRQIQGLFLNAQVEEAPDYTIFNPTDLVAAGYLVFDGPYHLPIRSYKESEADTFAPILSTLSKLDENGDGAVIQIVVKPAGPIAKKSISGVLEKLKKGEKLSATTKAKPFISAGEVADILIGSNKKTKDDTPKTVDEEAVKALQQKISKPLFSVNARILASADSIDKAESIFVSMGSAFSQFSAPVRNSFKIIKAKRQKKKIIFDYIFRRFQSAEAMILNSEELASIFHLPTMTTDVPRVKWLKTKEAPPPSDLPHEGLALGDSVFRNEIKEVKIADDDRRRHFYIIGQTGTGKSYLMLNMAVQDMVSGRGLCVIDPHGELVDKVLERVPKDRVNDVIYFDPSDLSRPMGLNMLEYDFNRPEEKTFIVGEIQSIFNQLFMKETMGPMFEQYMRNALLLLMEDAKNEPATFMEVPKIFTDEAFRNRKLSRLTNPTVLDFWQKEAVKTTGEQGLANMSPYITSKFGNFIANDYMRPIIGQAQSAFNFRQVMDEGKILLVNLAKGRIGDINSSLLGMIFTGRILLAALSRGDLPEDKRRDFYLYIDEFQNYTTESISVILSEARKYRLNLIIAHQFIAQLTDEIREAVFGNVGTLAAFRVGVPDNETLVKQFGPVFDERDLITIANQNALLRLLIAGEPAKPFNIKTKKAVAGSPEVRDKLKELSRLTYGRDFSSVEAEILSRLR